jgi:peptide/nickel transport system ATP-binding protein
MRAFPHELSGGLRQRVMIAIAVAGNPELIIADEPTTALDVTVQAQVLALLQRLRAEIGCSIVLITHDLGVAAQIADRIAVLYAGRIAEIGPTAEVLATPAHPYTHGLLQSRLTLDTLRDRPLAAMAGQVPSPTAPLSGCAFVPRCALARAECSATPPDPAVVGTDRVSACIIAPDQMRAELAAVVAAETEAFAENAEVDVEQPPAVDARLVTKSFTVRRRWLDRSGPQQSKLQALRGVSLTVAHGESVALVGESGSGKSTLLRIIAGLEKPTTGEVELAGNTSPQMVFQDAGASLTPWLSVGELIGERLRTLSRAERKEAIAKVLERVGLPQDIIKSRAAQLSGGQRQRVSLARATVIPPQVLLCDEPTSALDVSLAASVLNLIGELRRGLDMSVVFVTHDLSVARVVADRIAVMYLGRIVEIGPAEEVIGRPTHPYTQALVDAIPDLGRDCRVLSGEPASPLSPPTGCAFHPRCPIAIDTCSDIELDVRLEGIPGSPHQVACIERKAR